MVKFNTTRGFTLMELMVVLTIIALMLTVAVPRYFHGIDKAKEATLKHDLVVLRECIDKFHADQGRYPSSLEELAERRYIRAIPEDPITGSAATWIIIEPEPPSTGHVYDVRSGAPGMARNGSRYQDW